MVGLLALDLLAAEGPFGLADAEQRGRLDRAGVDGEAGDDDARDVGDGQRHGAADGVQRGQAEAEHDRVRHA